MSDEGLEFDLSGIEEDEPEEAEEVDPDDIETDYELSENVVEDLVDYSRSRIIRNESQFVLSTLGYVSGFMSDIDHYVSGVFIGTSSSGKSHVQSAIENIFPEQYMYQATTGTDKAIIYDRDKWNRALVASLDEIQKNSDEIVEILKSLHGGEDDVFKYKVTGDGMGADRDTDEIELEPMPFWTLYAQHDPDFELWNRLIKIPVHESTEKNEAVVKNKWGHDLISFEDGHDTEYMFDFTEGAKALEKHFLEMPKDARAKIPAGEEEYGWDAIEHAIDIFNVSRSEVNRVGSMVANLVRASALLNFKNRDKKEVHFDNDGWHEAYIAEPQDLANVLTCREVLLATTHEIDRKKKTICTGIKSEGGTENKATIADIKSYIDKSDAPNVKRPEMKSMLQDLIENYLVRRHENAASSGGNLYEFMGWQKMGHISVNERFRELFSDIQDPLTGDDFLDRVKELNERVQPDVSDFEADTGVDTETETEQRDASGKKRVNLEPHVEAVRRLMHENSDGRLDNDILDDFGKSESDELTLYDLLGVDEEETEGSVFDAEHALWTYGSAPDGWIQSESDAHTAINKAAQELNDKDIFVPVPMEVDDQGEPTKRKIMVKGSDDLDVTIDGGDSEGLSAIIE